MTNEELEKKLKSTSELDKFKDKPSSTGTGEAKELKIKRTIKLQEAHANKCGIWLKGKSSWYFSTGDKGHSERHHWTFAVCEINNTEYVLSWYWYPPSKFQRK